MEQAPTTICKHTLLRGILKGKQCGAITNGADFCDHHKNLKHHELFLCQAKKVINNKYVPCTNYTVSASHRCNSHKLRNDRPLKVKEEV
jgi:hypothetical protein